MGSIKTVYDTPADWKDVGMEVWFYENSVPLLPVLAGAGYAFLGLFLDAR